ncbi:MAG: phosphotransferase, partial [Deltaproteobacteria bacterium]|nr:phosphotransferase [Deltaproteobacteria bacterium]
MKHITCRTYNSFNVGSTLSLTAKQYEKLIKNFTCSKINVDSGLEGRASVTRIQLDGIGPVVIKHYMRGGLFGHFIKHFYLKLGKPRSKMEYEQMERARGFGISVPEPICFAFRGIAFYSAWLVTREIENQLSLAQLSMMDIESAMSAVKKLALQILILIDNRIYHRDLHPGNVLVDKNHQIHIIDFDKAGYFRGEKKALLKNYIKRLGRAVIKHNLPRA